GQLAPTDSAESRIAWVPEGRDQRPIKRPECWVRCTIAPRQGLPGRAPQSRHSDELRATLYVDGANPIRAKIKEIVPEYSYFSKAHSSQDKCLEARKFAVGM